MLFTIDAVLQAVDNLLLVTEKLSPAILDWLEARIPFEKQNLMARRLRKCKRICRRQNLNAALIANEVALLFADLPPALLADISTLIIHDLLNTKN
jgi:hypothetical protein